ncbi:MULTISPECIES: hypothetical protein [Streptomyces]|uniref:hypothetical protein n=1 Tax=Streptomyces TaxID=1883 RepID=UPI0004D5C726
MPERTPDTATADTTASGTVNPDTATADTATPGTAARPAAPPDPPSGDRLRLGSGPGRLLVLLYGVFTVGAASRSIAQMLMKFDEAPLAYVLSAAAACVYAVILFSLVRGGEGARRLGQVCCGLELTGVLAVGTWTLVDPSAFPDATVWSDYGMGYLFLPLVLPVAALFWLRGARRT